MFDIQLPKLSKGKHGPNEKEMCAMELVSFMERLPHSDSPPCTCPVLAAYVRAINDRMDDNTRQLLLPYLSRLVGTVLPEHEKDRLQYIAMMAVNVFAAKVCRGLIDEHLVLAMELATELVGAKKAAYAAYDAAAPAAADYDAYTASSVGGAAKAAAYTASSVGGAAEAADSAAADYDAIASAAAYAADSAADVVGNWDDALIGLDGMLAIGASTTKLQWSKERAKEAVERITV